MSRMHFVVVEHVALPVRFLRSTPPVIAQIVYLAVGSAALNTASYPRLQFGMMQNPPDRLEVSCCARGRALVRGESAAIGRLQPSEFARKFSRLSIENNG